MRIKALVFTEGLTLAGARRRLEEEETPASAAAPGPVVATEARERLGEIRSGLRSLLDMLGNAPPKKAAGWLPAVQPALLEFESGDGTPAAPAGAAKRSSKKKPAKP